LSDAAPRPWPAARARRVVTAALGIALVLAGIATTRAVLTARAEFGRGEEADARGDLALARDAYERAARMRVPGLGAPRRALDRLEALAAAASAAGDEASARAALEAERRALLGSRALGVSDPARLARVNARLGELLARADTVGGDEAARRAWHAAALARDEAPAPGWAIAAVAGFGLWVLGGTALALRGLDRALRLRRPALVAVAAIVVGLALFIVGLARA
jgi:hypothetical protein